MGIPSLIEKMSVYIPENQSIDSSVVDNFIISKNISIRDEHRQLFINYGNNRKLLNSGFSDFTFDNFKEYYLDEEVFYTDRIPPNTVFVGMDFNDELLCIDNDIGTIYVYCDQKKDFIYYDSLENLLFYCFLRSNYLDVLFEYVKYGVSIKEFELFLNKNEVNKVSTTDIRGHSYYLVEDKLYEVDRCYATANVYKGGVLSDIIGIRSTL